MVLITYYFKARNNTMEATASTKEVFVDRMKARAMRDFDKAANYISNLYGIPFDEVTKDVTIKIWNSHKDEILALRKISNGVRHNWA